jgi:Domain of unknown function (DUF4382)
MNSRNYLFPVMMIISLLVLLFVAASCSRSNNGGDNANGSGNGQGNRSKVSVYFTDHQTPLFDKVNLHIIKLEIKVEDNGTDSLGGWYNLNITPGIFDVLRFRNGFDTLFASGTIPANRKLQKIRMTLGNQNTVVTGGSTFPLDIKDNDNEVVANLDDSNVDFTPPDQFLFWIDFDAHQSIQVKSNNRFELKSHIKIFTKSKSGRIEGRVLPTAARAIVKAINGSDTATALPEPNGEYKIVALRAGTYKLLFDATANNYQDTLVNNIIVRHNEDTQVNTITLHQ